MVRVRHIRSYLTEIEVRDGNRVQARMILLGKRVAALHLTGEKNFYLTNHDMPDRVRVHIIKWGNGLGASHSVPAHPIDLSRMAGYYNVEVV